MLVEARHLPDWFRETVGIASSVSDRLGVVLVANVKGSTRPLDDYEGDSIITEFLSSSELDDLLNAFEKADVYCEAVVDEQGFLEWLREKRPHFGRQIPLVYNLAQNGTGPARLTLVPGLCRLYGLQLLDSDGYSVAMAQHKFHASAILKHFGLPAARSWWFTPSGWWPQAPPRNLRLIAKPTYDSASIGIDKDSVFTMNDGVDQQLSRRLKQYKQPLTVQEFISGFEVEVPVFEGEIARTVMAVGIELERARNLGDEFMVYERVYTDSYGFYDFADENAESAAKVRALAEQAFRILGFSGIARVDFRVRSDGVPFIIETACKPHITRHSSFSFAVSGFGASQSDLMKFLLGSAAKRYGLI
jgi:D-alanine-D-alanine ligase